MDKNAIIIGVIGSRTFDDYDYMKKILKWYNIKKIISGGAKGADRLSEQYALEHNIPCKVFPAQWEKYGKSAGYKRNMLIIESSDEIIAFWDGSSRGTKISIDLANKHGKNVSIYWPDANNDDEFMQSLGIT